MDGSGGGVGARCWCTEDSEDVGETTLPKVVLAAGDGSGSSSEINCAPSSALSFSSVPVLIFVFAPAFGFVWGADSGAGVTCPSDHGDLSGGSDDADGGAFALRAGDGGTSPAVAVVGVCGGATCTKLSSNHWPERGGGGRDWRAGEPAIGPARREGWMLFAGCAGSCGAKSSVSAYFTSGPGCVFGGAAPDRGGAGAANASCERGVGAGAGGGTSSTFVCREPYEIDGTGSPDGAGGSGGEAFDWKRTLAWLMRSSMSVS